MGSNYKYSASSRIPIRPLSYDNVSLAFPRELIIDYKNAKMYICNLDGKIIDISEKVIEETKELISEALNSGETEDIVRDIEITLENGDVVTIESAIVELFKELSNVNKYIKNVETSMPKAASSTPLASNEEGSIGTKTKAYALEDHIHPKGKATIADSANSVEWDNVKNVPSFSSSDHNHDSVYFKKSGGDINGDVAIVNSKGLYGYTTSNAKAMISYIDSNNRIHIGYNNTYPILLDAKLILNSSNYGYNEPSTQGAVTGQIYFQLIDE